MSVHNFWNSFSYGFANGIFNSNPFIFGSVGLGSSNFNSPYCCNLFSCCGNIGPFSNASLFMYPNVMSGSFTPLMQDFFLPMPTFSMQNNWSQEFDLTGIVDIFQKSWGTLNYVTDEPLLFEKPYKQKTLDIEKGLQNNYTKIQTSVATASVGNSRRENLEKETVDSQIRTYSTVTNKNEETIKNEKQTVNPSYDISNLRAKWKKKKPDLNLSDEFYSKIIKISKKIQCEPNDLMGIINLETRGTFSPSILNPSSGATGLIQFMPKYVHEYGTTISELKTMTREEQLDYVEIYFDKKIKAHKIKGKIDSATLYALVFYPKASNKTGEYIIARKGSKVYRENKSLDANNDRKITKSDLEKKLKEFKA